MLIAKHSEVGIDIQLMHLMRGAQALTERNVCGDECKLPRDVRPAETDHASLTGCTASEFGPNAVGINAAIRLTGSCHATLAAR